MLKRLGLAFVALLMLSVAPSVVAQGISQKVAVCDPNYVNSCMGTGPKAGTDISGTVATGNTFQTILALSASRRACTIQNPTTATEVLYVNFGVLGSATTAKSYSLAAGAAIQCGNPGGAIDTRAVNVTAATSTHAFVASYQ